MWLVRWRAVKPCDFASRGIQVLRSAGGYIGLRSRRLYETKHSPLANSDGMNESRKLLYEPLRCHCLPGRPFHTAAADCIADWDCTIGTTRISKEFPLHAHASLLARKKLHSGQGDSCCNADSRSKSAPPLITTDECMSATVPLL